MRRQLDAHLPPGLPGGSGLLGLVVHEALTLCRPLLIADWHRDARLFPVLFVWMPAVEGNPGRDQLVLGEHLAQHPVRRAGRVFGSGVDKEAGSVGRHRDATPEPAARVVPDVVLPDGLNRFAGVSRVAERDGHPPVIGHASDSMPLTPATA